MLKTALLVLMLMLSPLAVSAESAVSSSIVVIADFSFSMAVSYQPNKAAPFRGYAELFNVISSGSGADVEWALVAFDDVSSTHIEVPFGKPKSAITRHLGDAQPWARSPLQDVLDSATDYLVENGSGEELVLWILSDFIATDPHPLSIPQMSKAIDNNVRIVVTSPGLPDNNVLERQIANAVESFGGIYLHLNNRNEIFQALFSDQNIRTSIEFPSTSEFHSPTSISHETTGSIADKPTLRIRLSLLFLLPAIVFAFISYRSFMLYISNARKSSIVHTGEPKAILVVLNPDGTRTRQHAVGFPARVGADQTADIVLVDERIKSKKARAGFTVEYDGSDVFFTSPLKTLVSGVALKNKKLHVNDRIHYGKYRLLFLGIEREEIRRTTPPRPLFLWQPAASIVSVIMAFLFWNPFAVSAQKQSAIQKALPEENISNVAAEVLPSKSVSVAEYGNMVLVAPGEPIPAQDIDILCIHAHPDDESLDFGALIASASQAGLSVAVLILTDGEGGIDQYPRRTINQMYPSYDLSGAALSSIRVIEAADALEILNADMYIRMGLLNNPYDSSDDVLSTRSVINRWGGRDSITQKIASIIRLLTPEIVVSPDAKSAALEHFEHEATGRIVLDAIQALENENAYPQGHLVSVDPLQRDSYPNAIGVDAMVLSGRAIQMAALSEYHTQRDADVIGAEVLPRFAFELYGVKHWLLAVKPDRYFTAAR